MMAMERGGRVVDVLSTEGNSEDVKVRRLGYCPDRPLPHVTYKMPRIGCRHSPQLMRRSKWPLPRCKLTRVSNTAPLVTHTPLTTTSQISTRTASVPSY